MFPFFTASIIIFALLAYLRNKSTQNQDEVERKFWEREQAANNTRRQDISKLNYITIPLEDFPLGLNTTSEKALIALSEHRILNLEGATNTQLKLQYGAANLEELSQYETNFILMQQTIDTYASDLEGVGRIEDAIQVLEFAISNGADIHGLFLHLASLYQQNNQQSKIKGLIEAAEKLQTLNKDGLIMKLQRQLGAGLQKEPDIPL